MTILAASEARANLYRLIVQAAESHEPILICGKITGAFFWPKKIGILFKRHSFCFPYLDFESR